MLGKKNLRYLLRSTRTNLTFDFRISFKTRSSARSTDVNFRINTYKYVKESARKRVSDNLRTWHMRSYRFRIWHVRESFLHSAVKQLRISRCGHETKPLGVAHWRAFVLRSRRSRSLRSGRRFAEALYRAHGGHPMVHRHSSEKNRYSRELYCCCSVWTYILPKRWWLRLKKPAGRVKRRRT